MTPAEIKNVFISHIHEDDDCIAKLKELVGKHGLAVRDASITEDKPNDAKDPAYIRHKILAPHIQWAGTLVVYISPNTKNSAHVTWEIEYAHKHGKRIVGVWSHGAGPCEIPDALDRFGDALVHWQGEILVAAITGDCDDWYDREGMPNRSRSLKQASG